MILGSEVPLQTWIPTPALRGCFFGMRNSGRDASVPTFAGLYRKGEERVAGGRSKGCKCPLRSFPRQRIPGRTPRNCRRLCRC